MQVATATAHQSKVAVCRYLLILVGIFVQMLAPYSQDVQCYRQLLPLQYFILKKINDTTNIERTVFKKPLAIHEKINKISINDRIYLSKLTIQYVCALSMLAIV